MGSTPEQRRPVQRGRGLRHRGRRPPGPRTAWSGTTSGSRSPRWSTAAAASPPTCGSRGLGAVTERAGAGRPRVGPGPPRHLPLQRQRVHRVDARRLASTGGAVQRQLPLRRGRAALPARQRPLPGARLPRRVRPDGWPPSATGSPSSRCCSRWPTVRATTSCPAPSTTRRPSPAPTPTPSRASPHRPTTSTSSTPAAPPACPRASCGASTTSSCRRWAAGTSSPRRRSAASTTWPPAAGPSTTR